MFDTKGRFGESIEFKADASGKVTEAILYSADYVVVIKKKQPRCISIQKRASILL